MRDVILEGIRAVLGNQTSKAPKKGAQNLLLEFAGKASTNTVKGSTHHDDVIYRKK